MIIETSIPVVEDVAALDLLAAETGISRTRLKEAMTKGAVWLTRNKKTRRLRRATSRLSKGDTVAIYYAEEILSAEPPEPLLIADERDFSVWHKPAGMLSSGSRYGDHCAIDRYLELSLKRPVFLVHRLDQFARGLMVLAHGKKAAAALSKQFQDRTVDKRYKVVVRGVMDSAITIDDALDGRSAITHVEPIENNGIDTLIEARIETGRKHQIRRHLAAIGHPVAGDRQYGNDESGELILASCVLAFDHPLKDERLNYRLPPALHPHL